MKRIMSGVTLLLLIGVMVSGAIYVTNDKTNDDVIVGQTLISTTFGDWVVKCVQRENGLPCEMSQRLVDGKTGLALTRFSIAWSPSEDKHALQITVPLGVWLEAGAAMGVGDLKIEGIQYSRCLPSGCMIEALLENPMLSALRSGEEGQLIIFDRMRKPIVLPFSLRGFAEAEARLRRDTGGFNKGKFSFEATVDAVSSWFEKK